MTVLSAKDEEKDLELIGKARDYYKEKMGAETVSPSAVILKEDGTPEMDANDLPVFKDSIEWTTNNAQIYAIWGCIREVLEQGLVPANEENGTFGLMKLIAKMERVGQKNSWNVELPVNYFVGMLHILNMVRTYKLADKDKAFEAAIEQLALDFARRLDAYRGIKDREATMEKTPQQLIEEKNTQAVAKLDNVSYF